MLGTVAPRLQHKQASEPKPLVAAGEEALAKERSWRLVTDAPTLKGSFKGGPQVDHEGSWKKCC